ncbi:hypothetical protein [Methylobacterium sp. J-070]|uniref:hypothetical protein n=1 Tax=Methylobacterium sp. J-070 TaxID=2836650 RepID=UPI001FBAB494|nr:hypothetical protein [Methylobacterium sp. J-070]MCJ2052618.1 hypothetical protein [Methylobacterium sp. J-070]
MSIFDAISGGAAQTAFKNNMQTINTGLNQQSTALGDNYTSADNYLLGSGLPALNAGYNAGVSNLGTGYGNQRIDLNAGYMSGQDALNSNYGAALGSLGQGRSDLQSNYGLANDALTQNYGQARTDLTNQYGQTQGYLGQATASYAPMVQGGSNAFNQFLNATGANGAAGSQAALANFQEAPGYQYSLDQALGSVQRSAAARGGLAGGNATSDILNTANGLASQGYQQYVNNLNTGAGYYTTGLAGQAAGLTNQANASQAYGNALGNVDTGLGNALSSNFTGLGNALNANDTQAAGIYQNLGNALNTNNIGLGTSLGSADANLGTGQSALNVSNGTGTYGAYNQLGSNLMNLGNQESAAIQNATKQYVDNQNTEAKNQMTASGNLLGMLGGIASSPVTGNVLSGLGKIFS